MKTIDLSTPVTAYLGCGSNLGDRRENLRLGLAFLAEQPGLEVAEVSPVYETEPYGPIPQGPFLNLVAAVSTTLPPEALLDACLEAEQVLGRVRTVRWGPRTLDMDILLYGDATWQSERLVVPHAELTQRSFVLVPLADLAAEKVVAGRTVRAWRDRLDAAPLPSVGVLYAS